MRETWMSWFRRDPHMNAFMRVIFLVGVPEGFQNRSDYALFQKQMSAEINEFGDILLMEVADTYMNITRKVS